MFEDHVLKQLEDGTPRAGWKALMRLMLQLSKALLQESISLLCKKNKKNKGMVGFVSSQSVALFAKGTPSQ